MGLFCIKLWYDVFHQRREPRKRKALTQDIPLSILVQIRKFPEQKQIFR
jgi:hypothetical protein